MLNFVALDFETANSFRGSPCALGMVRVRNGEIVDEVRTLMRPPKRHSHFDGRNIGVHGITPSMVMEAPAWSELLPLLVEYVGDDVVVTHNADFDIGVIRAACVADGLEWPELTFLCSLVLARSALRLPSYRLPFVVEALGQSMGNHHDPLDDARGVAAVVRALAEREAVASLEALAETLGVPLGRMNAGSYTSTTADSRDWVSNSPSSVGGRLEMPETNVDADPGGYLYGRTVVFTGALVSMGSQQAWEECARMGAFPEPNTTKRTNVLVLGDVNPASLRPGADLTEKAKKAFDLQLKGQCIEVMTEDDFLRCLGAF
jgi:DNA polymerase-3 subunit epsilon